MICERRTYNTYSLGKSEAIVAVIFNFERPAFDRFGQEHMNSWPVDLHVRSHEADLLAVFRCGKTEMNDTDVLKIDGRRPSGDMSISSYVKHRWPYHCAFKPGTAMVRSFSSPTRRKWSGTRSAGSILERPLGATPCSRKANG